MNLWVICTFDLNFFSLQVELTRKLFSNQLSDITEDTVNLTCVDIKLIEEMEKMS